VPYIFADYWRAIVPGAAGADSATAERSRPYRAWLVAIATVPMLGLFFGFREVQKLYAVFGALFMPLLAATLLVLDRRPDGASPGLRNRPLTTVVLAATVALFLYFGYLELAGRAAG